MNIARILKDHVITASEVESDEGLADYTELMTPAARDVFEARKAKTAVVASKPAWYPPDLDLAAVAEKAKAWVDGGTAGVDKLLFSDGDLTLLKTTTPVLLRDKTSGALFNDPATGKPVLLGVGAKREYTSEFEALKARLPDVDFSRYTFDFKEFDSIAEILHTDEIPSTVKALKASDKDAGSRDFIITARGGNDVAAGMDMYLDKRGVDINGVFAVNNGGVLQDLGLADYKLNGAQRKAVVMAALIALYKPARVTFLDDTDANLIAAMQLLPKLYPTVAFDFSDVVHTGNNHFTQRTIARGAGELTTKAGKPLTQAMIDAYKSNDKPFA